jgi:hypothetical protein
VSHLRTLRGHHGCPHGGYYWVVVSGGGGRTGLSVCAPAHLTHAVDSAAAYDAAAHAALSFVEDGSGGAIGEHAAHTGSGGWHIGRTKATAWPRGRAGGMLPRGAFTPASGHTGEAFNGDIHGIDVYDPFRWAILRRVAARPGIRVAGTLRGTSVPEERALTELHERGYVVFRDDTPTRPLAGQNVYLTAKGEVALAARHEFSKKIGRPAGRAAGESGRSGLTLAEARAQVRPLGFSLKSREGEYLLTPWGEREGSRTYYTHDLGDAVDTARQASSKIVTRRTTSGANRRRRGQAA